MTSEKPFLDPSNDHGLDDTPFVGTPKSEDVNKDTQISASGNISYTAGSNVISFPAPGAENCQSQEITGETTLSFGSSSSAPKKKKKEQKKEGKEFIAVCRYKNNHAREYSSWSNMKQRCRTMGYVLDPRFVTFKDFYSHMGPKPGPDYTLDRIDHNNPEYSPENCRWASKALQTANRRNTRMLEHSDGSCYSAAEWGRRTGISGPRILARVDNGWTVDEAVSVPIGQRRQRASSPFVSTTSSAPALAVWRRVLCNVHGQEFYSATATDKKMLKDIVGRFDSEIDCDPLEALECVMNHWPAFVAFAEDSWGAFNSPTIPTLGYLMRYLNAAGNWVDQRLRAYKERCQQKADRDRIEQKRGEKVEFVASYLGGSCYYREILEYLWRAQATPGDDPDSCVTDETRLEYWERLAEVWAQRHGLLDLSDFRGKRAHLCDLREKIRCEDRELYELGCGVLNEANDAFYDKYPEEDPYHYVH